MSAQQTTIHERMIAILGELPPIGKTQRNEQQGFMFRGQDDMLNALNPLFAKHGVFVIPDVVDRDTDQRTTSRGSVMFVVNLHVRFTAYGAAGDSVSGSAWGEGTDMGDKATSKAMTMAFKYWLNQAFLISTAETVDPDRDTPPETARAEPKPRTAERPPMAARPPRSSTRMATGPQIGKMGELAKALNEAASPIPADYTGAEDWVAVLKMRLQGEYQVEHRNELRAAQANELIDWLDAQAIPF